MKNCIGRELPDTIGTFDGNTPVRPFAGEFVLASSQTSRSRLRPPSGWVARPGDEKLLARLEDVFKRIPIRDGMTVSFHHHLRNGDGVVNAVLAQAAKLGLRQLKVALVSVFPVHAPMAQHIASGVVGALETNFITGPVAEAVSRGALKHPVILRTHGGRARAIECGELHIDVAFIAASAADTYGNITGRIGPNAFGSLGYAFPDAEQADWVVAVTDHVVGYPLAPISIPQHRVDFVVRLPTIGDASGILSGTTRLTQDPLRLALAETAAKVIEAAGLLHDGFSYQTGAGGTSLAVTQFVKRMMAARGVVGSFALGGITADIVAMLEQGLFRRVLDVQGFDLEAVRSIATNPNHIEIGSSFYANPFTKGCAVNKLDCVILGATEVDTKFNVNVVTGSDGILRGGSGGHSDAAAGAKLTIVVATTRRGTLPIIIDDVVTVTTPGESIDVVVTEAGVAVNPRRADLAGQLKRAGLMVKDITELRDSARAGLNPLPCKTSDRIVAIMEYRDGTVIDVVRQVEP